MNGFIEKACEQFKTVLLEQLAWTEKMKNAEPAIDYEHLDKLVIGVCGGDGIGPIISDACVVALKKLLAEDIAAGKVEIRVIEGLTLENRIAKDAAVPADVLEEIRQCHVLLKGPTTTPQGGTGKKDLESANVALRRELDLFANVRPVSVPDKGIDWTFFRENTEGEYVLGSRGVEIPGSLTCDFKVITRPGTERIARAAFEFARLNGKKSVAIVTKANILKKTDGSFSAICHEVAKDYPDIEATDWYIDIMTAKLLDERVRHTFQVFVLPNLYGDIITDEAAQIQGGVGTAGSANTGSRYAMFEAIHGSAPRMIERGEGGYANPQSMLSATVMMLRHVGRAREAARLEEAMQAMADEGICVITGHADGASCAEYAACLAERL